MWWLMTKTSGTSNLYILVERHFNFTQVLHHATRETFCCTELHTEYKTRWFTAILHMLKWFAGHQIRNVGVSTLVWFLKKKNSEEIRVENFYKAL